MQNMNVQTGVRYGTIYGNVVPELCDDIFSSGTDTTHLAMRQEIKDNLASGLGKIEIKTTEADGEVQPLADVDPDARKALTTEIREAISSATDDWRKAKDLDVDEVLETLVNQEEVDTEALLSDLEDRGLWDNDSDCEGHEYDYTLDTDEGPVKLQLTWLGGATLIFVLDSPWVVRCARCSPCCPNAGDLDNKGSIMAYCLPPDELPEGYEGNKPWLYGKETEPEENDE